MIVVIYGSATQRGFGRVKFILGRDRCGCPFFAQMSLFPWNRPTCCYYHALDSMESGCLTSKFNSFLVLTSFSGLSELVTGPRCGQPRAAYRPKAHIQVLKVRLLTASKFFKVTIELRP